MTRVDPGKVPPSDLAAAIANEDEAVGVVSELLQERRPVAEWPAELRAALAGALATDPCDPREGTKAARLSAHLFGGLPAEIRPSPDHRRTRLAERFRADLADLVPAGAGLYLIDLAQRVTVHAVCRDGNVRFDDALAIFQEILSCHHARHGSIPCTVVAVGDTALAAHGLQPASIGVDLYIPDLDDDVIAEVQSPARRRFGTRFKIDVTPSETLWSPLACRDIDQAPVIQTLAMEGHRIDLRALDLETLYLLKVIDGRESAARDRRDIASRTSAERVTARCSHTLPWFGDRPRLPEYIDALTNSLSRDFHLSQQTIDRMISLPNIVRQRVDELRQLAARCAGLRRYEGDCG